MRLLRVLMVAVAGLIVCGIVVDSYGARVPTRDIGIPIYFGDPGDIYDARPRDRERLEVSLDAKFDRVGSLEVRMMRMFAWFMGVDLRSECQGTTARKVCCSNKSRAVGYIRSYGD